MAGIVMGEADLGLRVVQANEILAKIAENKPINYSNVIIEGDLCFDSNDTNVGTYVSWNIKYHGPSLKFLIKNEHSSKSSLPSTLKLVNPSIKIKNSIIKGVVKFNNSLFQNAVTFINTTFCKDIYFVNSTFVKHAYFGDSKFENAYFTLTNFSGPANFNNARFYGFALFRGTKFDQYADFSGTQFERYAEFFAAQFDKHANLNPNDIFSPEEKWFESGKDKTPDGYRITEIGASLGETSFGKVNFPEQNAPFSINSYLLGGTVLGNFSTNNSYNDAKFQIKNGKNLMWSLRTYLGDFPTGKAV